MDASDRLTEEYLGRYEGVTSETLHMTRFDKNSDLSMTYMVNETWLEITKW